MNRHELFIAMIISFQTNTLESQFSELKKACEHEENKLRKVSMDIENTLIEIDNLSRKIAKA